MKASALAGFTAAAAGSAAEWAGSGGATAAANVSKYQQLVPEIFAPLADPPTYTPAVIIGSGFGGAVSALRFAQAGINVTVLERGSRWPNDPQREIFTTDAAPDGRGYWHNPSRTGFWGLVGSGEDFGGVLDAGLYGGVNVLRGAAVGGGSVVFTGVMIEPERRFFDAIFGGKVSYDEMHNKYYPRVRQMLRVSPMPADVMNSSPFTHTRTWNQQAAAAGYNVQIPDSIANWDVVRSELAGKSRASATTGLSNFGNSNGAKFDLNQNYLKQAEASGRATVYPGHQVTSIGRNSAGKYTISVTKMDPTGAVLSQRTLTCDYLVLAAGSMGTSELLVKAKATGTLPNLNSATGQGWGTNGDSMVIRALAYQDLFSSPGAFCGGRILDERGDLPVTLENWYTQSAPSVNNLLPSLGLGTTAGIVASLGMAMDPTRGAFRYDSAAGKVVLDFPTNGTQRATNAAQAVNSKIASGALQIVQPPLDPFTAHPLGGAVLNQATDSYGRVAGYSGLYVMDGAAVPGSTGTVNPSLTIAALAERNVEAILAAGG